jgi:hypothetical protein
MPRKGRKRMPKGLGRPLKKSTKKAKYAPLTPWVGHAFKRPRPA